MVLVVDDDPDIREAIRQTLESEGYGVVTAADGREALDQLQTHPRVSLILADMRMPTMDGQELIAALRCKGNPTPVVVLSALSELRREGSLRLRSITGAAEVLGKPFNIETLLRVVAHHVSSARN